MNGKERLFAGRVDIALVEWDNQRKDWIRPPVDRTVLKELAERDHLLFCPDAHVEQSHVCASESQAAPSLSGGSLP